MTELLVMLRTTVEGMNESAKSDSTLLGAAAGKVLEEDKFVYVAGWSSVEVSKCSGAQSSCRLTVSFAGP